MAEKIVSPGVFTNEIDQSFIPAAIGELGAAIVGPTVKGPVLTPTVVSSFSEFTTIFGNVIESGSDKYQYLTSHTAQEYLRQGGPLTIVRVADADVSRATADIGGTVTGAVTAVNASVKVTISAIPDNTETISVQVGSGTPQVITFNAGAGTNSTSFTANAANLYLSNFSGTPTQQANAIAEAVQIIISSISGVTATSPDESGVVTITADVAETTTYNFTTANANSSGNIAFSENTSGVTGVAGNVTSFFSLEVLGDGPSFNNSSSIGTDNLILPLTSSAGNDHFSSGSFGGRSDNIRWEIANRNVEKGTFTLLIRQGDDTIKRKKILETHSNLSFDPESTDYILKRIGNTTNTIAVEQGLAYLQPVGEYPNQSRFVRVSNFPDNSKTPNYLDDNGDVTDAYKPDSGSFFPAVGSGSYNGTFAGGDFGQEIEHPFNFYENISAGNSQGIKMSDSAVAVGNSSTGGGYRTAISMLGNKDEYNFNLLFLPGVVDGLSNHSSIITAAVDLCETRTDCFLVLDSSSKTDSVLNVVKVAKGRNSSYAATYYPWVQVQDNILGTNRYVPPSVVIAGVYHFNDTVGQPWFAPAGLNRGGIDTAIQAFKKLTQSQRDTLYDANVNPIATFPGQGVTVFGQKTLQKKASALDRVNVRRLLINVKSFIARSSRNLLFEQNTSDLRDQFLNTVNPFLEQVQSNSGLNAFRVVMDDTNNTPETIDRNQLIGQIFLQPTRTAEFIVLDFIVQPTGAAFPE